MREFFGELFLLVFKEAAFLGAHGARLLGGLLRKTGYKQGDTLPGQILVVDDQWHGLNISTDFSIKIE